MNKLFPCFIDTIPNLSNESVKELKSFNLLAADEVTNASDDQLLAIKGIGKVKLIKIRDYCAGVRVGRDNQRIESSWVTSSIPVQAKIDTS
jgi:DNA repair protein RadC